MAETAAPSQHRLGIALIVAAAVAWSTAAVFTRLLPFDSWTILFWRGLFGGGVIAAMLLLTRGRGSLRDFTGMGSSGWLVASLSRAPAGEACGSAPARSRCWQRTWRRG